jgi:hypothetical protein
MPLTRNLYEIDEVSAALQHSLSQKNQSQFWLWELLRSEEDPLPALHYSWLMWGGGYDPYLLTERPSNDASWFALLNRIEHAISLALNQGDTLAHFLSLPESSDTETVTDDHRTLRKHKALQFSGDPEAWLALDFACRHHRSEVAIRCLQTLDAESKTWEALTLASRDIPLTLMLEAASDQHPLYVSMYQAVTAQLLCLKTADRKKRVESQSYVTPVCKWSTYDKTNGRRAGRLFSIPIEALTPQTTRGRIAAKYTNIADIREPVPLLGEGCAFWKRILTESGVTIDDGSVAFPSDDCYEAFMERYFPDDIPDEWSAADQQKSHGRGVKKLNGASQ